MDKLKVCCQHCDHQYDPEILEYIDLGTINHFRCEDCAKPFVVLIKECLICNKEQCFIWGRLPDQNLLSELSCQTCQRVFDLEAEAEA